MSFYIIEVDNDGFKVYDSTGTLIDPATEDTLNDIKTRVGEVSATPTANTLLERLKQIQDKDFATQATLALIDTKLGTIDSVLDLIKDTDGVKKIVDPLAAGTNRIGAVRLMDENDNIYDSVINNLIRRLETRGSLCSADGANDLTVSSGGKAHFVLYDDVNNIALAVADNTALPANTRGLMIAGIDDAGKSQFVTVEASGKLQVAAQPPQPPAGTTEFVLANSEAVLEIGGGDSPAETESAVIGNGVNLYIQQLVAGAAGDPSEKGSKVELYWREGAGPTDHLIDRVYVAGQTVVETLPDAHKARDGTVLTGNGTNTKLVLSRIRLSNADQEVDAIVRGYTD